MICGASTATAIKCSVGQPEGLLMTAKPPHCPRPFLVHHPPRRSAGAPCAAAPQGPRCTGRPAPTRASATSCPARRIGALRQTSREHDKRRQQEEAVLLGLARKGRPGVVPIKPFDSVPPSVVVSCAAAPTIRRAAGHGDDERGCGSGGAAFLGSPPAGGGRGMAGGVFVCMRGRSRCGPLLQTEAVFATMV